MALAYGDRVAFLLSEDTCQTSWPSTNKDRQQLLFFPGDPELITVPPSSFSHSANAPHNPKCIVFTGTKHHAMVTGVVPLPLTMAAMGSDHPST